jgi:hypothetical protein
MGGNALKEYGATRLDRAEYEKIASKLVNALNQIIQQAGVSGYATVIRAYRNKPSFGDIDVVVPRELHHAVSDTELSIQLPYLMNLYPAFVFKSNGPVTSFGIPLSTGGVFQADLIYTQADHFDFAVEYYSWNDLGNLIGRIAHKLGLRFGHDGLTMPLRDGDNLFDTIILTRDFKTAIEFLGYSNRQYQRGFDTMEDIFKFTINTYMFNSAIYDLDNRNHTARVRDKKRPTYTAFLAWLKEHPEVDKEFPFPKDKTFWHQVIWNYFPAALDEYSAAVARLQRVKFIKNKFNGDLIRGIIGLEGKELGGFITKFKGLFERPADFERWIIKTDQIDINFAIKALYDES